MCHTFSLSSRAKQEFVSEFMQVEGPCVLLLFLWRSFLRCGLLGCRFFLRSCLVCLSFDLRRFFGLGRRLHLFRLRLLLLDSRSFEALAIISNFRDANRSERLPVTGQFLILFFPLVVEYEDLVASSLPQHFTHNTRFRLRLANLTFACRNREHIPEFDLSIGAIPLALDANHVAGRDPVLLSTRADDGVHSYASVTRCC